MKQKVFGDQIKEVFVPNAINLKLLTEKNQVKKFKITTNATLSHKMIKALQSIAATEGKGITIKIRGTLLTINSTEL